MLFGKRFSRWSSRVRWALHVWGNLNITEEIRVNGHALAATTNLAALLRQLRPNRVGEIAVPRDYRRCFG